MGIHLYGRVSVGCGALLYRGSETILRYEYAYCVGLALSRGGEMIALCIRMWAFLLNALYLCATIPSLNFCLS